MTEIQKMLAGEWYDANYDKDIVKKRYACFDLCHELNSLKPTDPAKKQILQKLLGNLPEGLEIVSPFTCDYGANVSFGKNVFVNCYCYFMDGAKITVGNNVFIGPYCGFYTATHPVDYANRNKGLEKALPITIGDNCWFGANVSVMPGVKIGNGCVIATGSVVTKDLPDNVMVAGVPAKIIKAIEQ